MLEETAAGLPEDEESAERRAEWINEFFADIDDEADEPWKESLREHPPADGDNEDGIAKVDDVLDIKFHPLQRRAHDLMIRVYDFSTSQPEKSLSQGQLDALLQGAADIVGGLAQALGPEDCPIDYGLSIVQLKRALRGAAYALGSLLPLRTGGVLDQATFEELHKTIEALQTDIFAELTRYRERFTENF